MGKKKNAAVAGRQWSLLRLALRWARKCGSLKRGLMFDLRLFSQYLKSLGPGCGGRSDRLHDSEREFSFDETPPAFQFKTPSMWLPCLPCITPAVDFDHHNDYILFQHQKKECSMDGGEDNDKDDDSDDDEGIKCQELIELEEEQGIDSKAEKFIAQFYEQMKLQRQVSVRQYNEMLHRSMS